MEPQQNRHITSLEKEAFLKTFALIDLRYERSIQKKKYLENMKKCVDKTNTEEEKPKFVCDKIGCSKVYTNRQQLAAHSRKHQPKGSKKKKISKNKKQ